MEYVCGIPKNICVKLPICELMRLFRFLSLIFVLFWQENQKTFLVLACPG